MTPLETARLVLDWVEANVDLTKVPIAMGVRDFGALAHASEANVYVHLMAGSRANLDVVVAAIPWTRPPEGLEDLDTLLRAEGSAWGCESVAVTCRARS